MSKTKRLTIAAILAGLALVTFVIEAQIPPPVPLPGVKLGLANLYTLAAMSLLGRREAGAALWLPPAAALLYLAGIPF